MEERHIESCAYLYEIPQDNVSMGFENSKSDEKNEFVAVVIGP